MSKETEELDYSETLSDFSSAIQNKGALRVAGDFAKYFPNQSSEFVNATLTVNKARSIPSLFKPRELGNE